MKNAFYDAMSIKLGLPLMATAELWQTHGRFIVNGAKPRINALYGIESTYVARGVPVEEKPEAALALRDLFRDAMVRVGRANSFPQLFGGKPSATPTLDKLENTTERVRERLTWADTKPFNPFDGFLVTKGEVSQPTPASKFTSPDLKETSHQVSPGFGSAYIGKA